MEIATGNLPLEDLVLYALYLRYRFSNAYTLTEYMLSEYAKAIYEAAKADGYVLKAFKNDSSFYSKLLKYKDVITTNSCCEGDMIYILNSKSDTESYASEISTLLFDSVRHYAESESALNALFISKNDLLRRTLDNK